MVVNQMMYMKMQRRWPRVIWGLWTGSQESRFPVSLLCKLTKSPWAPISSSNTSGWSLLPHRGGYTDGIVLRMWMLSLSAEADVKRPKKQSCCKGHGDHPHAEPFLSHPHTHAPFLFCLFPLFPCDTPALCFTNSGLADRILILPLKPNNGTLFPICRGKKVSGLCVSLINVS